ncbi:MAG: hypothetical protein ACK4WD_10415 [Flavobacteriales bacterium]|jgi:hypothetical protein
MNVRSVLILVLFWFGMVGAIQAQNLLPSTGRAYRELEKFSIKNNQSIHLAHRPLHEFFLSDSSITFVEKDTVSYYFEPLLYLMRSHLLEAKGKGYRLSADPIGELLLGAEFPKSALTETDNNLYVNNRGVLVMGEIGERFSFQTGFYEMQRKAPSYQRTFVDSNDVFPGYGRVKDFKFKQYDHNMSFGNMTFKASDNWALELGYGQQFIGHGYRSLILTDGLFSYPYVRSTAYFFNKKILYSNTFGTMQNMERLPLGDVPESLFRRKGFSAHYLSFLPIPNLEVGLFEGSMWQRADNVATYSLPWNYYVPLIGLSSITEANSPRQNTFIGANLRVSLPQGISFYAQSMIDDFTSASLAFQGGVKFFDVLIKGLYLQAEYNKVSLKVDLDNRFQDLTHFNQFIGHPGGRSVEEWVLITEYRYGKFLSRAKVNWMESRFSEYDLRQAELEAGLQLNLKTNLEFVLGASHRQFDREYTWYYATIRTNLHARYFDF